MPQGGGRALFSSKSGVVVVGANVIDMVAYTPSVPKMGETVLGRDFNVGFGGKGANQAVIAARMPGCEKVSMISSVGDDTFGKQTIDNFSSNGVITDDVTTSSDCPTGAAAIIVDDASGDNCIVVVMGANDTLDEHK